MAIFNFDGFAKSPSAVLRLSLVTAAYSHVRLIPRLSQALHLELFALPSTLRWELCLFVLQTRSL
jgi:hypothetical protein